MRLYTFVNYYLSDLQRGLQTAHVVSELFNKYRQVGAPAKARKALYDWAGGEKTIIILNGGNSEELSKIYGMLARLEAKYPTADFYEDEQSLNGALTAVGIVLPASIYNAERYESLEGAFYTDITGVTTIQWKESMPEWPLVSTLKNYKLA